MEMRNVLLCCCLLSLPSIKEAWYPSAQVNQCYSNPQITQGTSLKPIQPQCLTACWFHPGRRSSPKLMACCRRWRCRRCNNQFERFPHQLRPSPLVHRIEAFHLVLKKSFLHTWADSDCAIQLQLPKFPCSTLISKEKLLKEGARLRLPLKQSVARCTSLWWGWIMGFIRPLRGLRAVP